MCVCGGVHVNGWAWVGDGITKGVCGWVWVYGVDGGFKWVWVWVGDSITKGVCVCVCMGWMVVLNGCRCGWAVRWCSGVVVGGMDCEWSGVL